MRWNSRYIAWPPRQPLGPGTACWQPVVGHMSESSDYEESGGSNLWPTDSCGPRGSVCVQAQPAGRQRDQGSLRCLSYACVAWPPRQQVEPGTARPLTLSNAVPWVRSERDTLRSSQLLVGA